ncbi:MAG: NigD-like protein [Dysgonamonadaceae bacterium]|jgi:hypothetical protein|nr:NigD-like protein [Dysgonamonadaceae bacterium]
MKNRFITFFIAILLVFIIGCKEESARMDDFKVDFATVLNENTQLRFLLDNGQILTPINPEMYSGETGQRVVMNYTPLEDNRIRIRGISNIFTGNIRTDGFSEQLAKEPVRIQSVWVAGNYLNMILEIQVHSVLHTIGLYRNPESETIDLYFSYSRNGDPAGNARMLYASFRLNELREEENVLVSFRLFMNTYSGMKEIEREFEMAIR